MPLGTVKGENSALQTKIQSLDAQYAQLQEQIMRQSELLEDEIKRNGALWT